MFISRGMVNFLRGGVTCVHDATRASNSDTRRVSASQSLTNFSMRAMSAADDATLLLDLERVGLAQ